MYFLIGMRILEEDCGIVLGVLGVGLIEVLGGCVVLFFIDGVIYLGLGIFGVGRGDVVFFGWWGGIFGCGGGCGVFWVMSWFCICWVSLLLILFFCIWFVLYFGGIGFCWFDGCFFLFIGCRKFFLFFLVFVVWVFCCGYVVFWWFLRLCFVGFWFWVYNGCGFGNVLVDFVKFCLIL